ncbi:MAG: fumarylacetoacetate hydrolase family protein [Ottowia sp.]|nr:fumarylacetoacetate hydrolase family protein [Ottowia sp.]
MTYFFTLSAPPAVPIVGHALAFPVHRIYCVGRNYADHTREMGGDLRDPPFFFAKPADAALPVHANTLGKVAYPEQTQDLHPELELVIAIGKEGKNISQASAHTYIFGYAIGLDMTRRDLQAEAKKLGRPWEIAKSYDHSAPIGPITQRTQCGELQQATLWLEVNEARRQSSDINQMIWSVNEIIAYLSRYFALMPGDLIYTGTPAGVASVVRGDLITAHITGLETLRIQIT